MKLKVDYVVTATGGGGTYAGLLLGKKMLNQNYKILGFNVSRPAEDAIKLILKHARAACKKYKQLDVKLRKRDVTIVDGYIGRGYAISRPEEIELLKEVALKEALVLDPVYTGKTMFGLRDQIKKGLMKKGSKILFLHTGGLFGLFPQKDLFSFNY